MRLFTAVLPDDGAREAIFAAVGELSSMCAFVRPVPRENIHLTLCFIGETENVAAAREAVAAVSAPGCLLELAAAGSFKREGGDTWWAGIRPVRELAALQSELADELRRRGFSVERREYRPHITLGREAAAGPEFDRAKLSARLSGISFPAGRVSLMRSERVGGKLVYTEIFGKDISIK